VSQRNRQAAIAGVHLTEQGDLTDRIQPEVWWEAVAGACADAGVEVGDIDGLVGEAPEGAGIRAFLPGAALGYDTLGKPLRFHATTAMGAAAAAANVHLAAYAVSSGLADVVVVATAAAGQAAGFASANRDDAVKTMAKLSGPYEYIYGTTRVSDYAVLAMRHMHEFGTTPAQLAEIAVAQRAGAVLHPLSVYGGRGALTVDDVLSSRMIADPLHLLDCCAINQGGGAVVVTSLDRARDSNHPPIQMLGYGEGHSHIDVNSSPDLATFPAAKLAADTAFDMAKVARTDIDVAGIADHFTINVVFGLESAGFCAVGEGGSFVESGALRLNGSLPTNTAGGFLSFSHAGSCGLFTLIELVEQLRGDAGGRQVRAAELAYLSGVGGAMQNNFSAIFGRA
jgi:acetyl-CoA acetyltransferase